MSMTTDVYYDKKDCLRLRVTRKDGKMYIYESFYENGAPHTYSTHKDGARHGVCKTFDENGKLKNVYNYVNGKQQEMEDITAAMNSASLLSPRET